MTKNEIVKFGEICREVKLTTKDPISDGYERYIGLEHLDSGSLKIKRWGVTKEDNPSFTRVFCRGHILLGKRRPYLKKAAIAEFDGICSSDIIVIEPKKELKDLFPFIVQSNDFWDWAVKTSSGSLSPRTKFKSLSSFKLMLPDKLGQNSLLQEVIKSDQVVKTTDQLVDCQETLIEAQYMETFKRQLGIFDCKAYPTKIYSASNTSIQPLRELISKKPQNGQFVKKGSIGEVKCLFLNVVDGYANPYSDEDKRELISCSQSEFEKYSLKNGDILFNRSSLVKSGIGWPYIVLNDSKPSTFDCHIIRVNVDTDKILPDYLYIYSLSPWARKYFLCVGQTTTMTTISQSEIENFPVPIPTIEHQKEIVQLFSNLFSLKGLYKSHIKNVSKLSSEYISKALKVN
ncbi:restriction endonuclease subunit S [Marinobacter maritimus]|uniref:restriction endonuclease subunit S n=1 Tax=Marinobacter maritimus TaxID=277961 RepID=UPI00119E17B7|nr:restriction endonuclease subunit S [Marinobacter maritimus]|tara:strand:+ start:951 stop:2156 length:1206 start_codon:yes stop_codon:yes gene_type:complete